jgi:hypothetical protein
MDVLLCTLLLVFCATVYVYHFNQPQPPPIIKKEKARQKNRLESKREKAAKKPTKPEEKKVAKITRKPAKSAAAEQNRADEPASGLEITAEEAALQRALALSLDSSKVASSLDNAKIQKAAQGNKRNKKKERKAAAAAVSKESKDAYNRRISETADIEVRDLRYNFRRVTLYHV